MTLSLVKDRLWKGGACIKPVPLGQGTGTSTTCPSGTSRLGQVVLVPVGQAGCLYQTCPTETRKGQKRPLLVLWDKSYTHAGGLSLSRDKLYTHNGACPSSTCPNLSHKLGLQGREKVSDSPNSLSEFFFSNSVVLCSFLWAVEWIHESPPFSFFKQRKAQRGLGRSIERWRYQCSFPAPS